MNEVKFHLHTNQGTVFKAENRFRVLVAGRRFGKTTLAITELLVKALSQNNQVLWYVAPSYRQAKMIAWRMLKNMVPQELNAKYNESELSITLPNGSLIELKGADNEDSLKGVGLDGMVIDEFATIYDNWTVWYEVLRPMLSDRKGWALFIGTPKGKDALWELYMKGQREEDEYKSWTFKTSDNPYIDPAEVDKARKDSPERYFRQEYEASFEDYVGLVWPEYSKDCVVKPFEIPKEWERLSAIDTAVTGITASLKAAVDEEGVLYFYSEYREENVRVSEVAGVIREKLKWIIDPDALKKQAQRDGYLYSLYDEYRDNGIIAKFAQKDVEGGINRVGELFKQGKIKIFSTLKWLPWELERYHYVESKETVKGQIKPVPFKKEDHLCDCLRYIVMERVETHINREQKAPKGSVAYELALDEIEKDNWRAKYE